MGFEDVSWKLIWADEVVISVSSLSANAVLLLSYIVPLESHSRPVILVTGLERYFSMSFFY